jgi:hypothetical protein
MSKDEPYIFVVTSDGEFLSYKIDFYQGGEGKLVNQYSYVPMRGGSFRLLDSPDERSATPAS